MDNKSKEFKALKSKWYSKLKKEGFEDIESSEDSLKVWETHVFTKRYGSTRFGAKRRYYELASHFLHEYKFDDDRTKLIWENHAAGVSIRGIVTILKIRGFTASKDTVQKPIQKLVKLMLDRYAVNESSSNG